jgi:hypothetical protein
MLQTIHKNYRAGEASSLYCIWTTRDGTPGSPLIAVWIDPSMRAFEGESSSTAQSDSEEVCSDEPGSCAFTGAAMWPQTQRNWNFPHVEESVEDRVAKDCPEHSVSMVAALAFSLDPVPTTRSGNWKSPK